MAGETARELIDKARKRQEELRREHEALDRFITTYTALLNNASETEIPSEAQLELYGGNNRRAAQARVAATVEAARRIILAEQRPMKRGELAQRLQREGYEIVGTDKNKVLGTNLWRSGKFDTIEDEGYWPKGVKKPR